MHIYKLTKPTVGEGKSEFLYIYSESGYIFKVLRSYI